MKRTREGLHSYRRVQSLLPPIILMIGFFLDWFRGIFQKKGAIYQKKNVLRSLVGDREYSGKDARYMLSRRKI